MITFKNDPMIKPKSAHPSIKSASTQSTFLFSLRRILSGRTSRRSLLETFATSSQHHRIGTTNQCHEECAALDEVRLTAESKRSVRDVLSNFSDQWTRGERHSRRAER